MAASRLQTVDLFRIAAMAAVIAVHVAPLETRQGLVGTEWNAATVLSQLARFAVPYFFVVSGFFWAGKAGEGPGVWPPTLKMARRLLLLFVAWSAVYIVAVNPLLGLEHAQMRIREHLDTVLAHPLQALITGSEIHLWFLMTLAMCLLLGALFLSRGLTLLLVALAVVLYVIGLLGKAYVDTPLGLPTGFDFRHGPFFGLLFFVTGVLLQQRGPKQSWLVPGLWLAAGGLLLQIVEVSLLHRWWQTTMRQDYVIGTYFLGLGVSMIALSRPGGDWPLVRALGPLVLGAYASHMLFVKLLWPMDAASNGRPLLDLLHFMAVFIMSFAASALLSRWRWTRPLAS